MTITNILLMILVCEAFCILCVLSAIHEKIRKEAG